MGWADSFDRADSSDIGADWVETGTGEAEILSDRLRLNSNGDTDQDIQVQTSTAILDGPDQHVQATYHAGNPGAFASNGLVARSNGTDTFYFLSYATGSGTVAYRYKWRIMRRVGGVWGLVALLDGAPAPADNDVIRFEVVGTSLRGLVNDVEVVSGSDAQIATGGHVGISYHQSLAGPRYVEWDDFRANLSSIDVGPAYEAESVSTVYPNHVGLHISDFGGTTAAWGSQSSIGKIAQTGWGIGDMLVTSVAVLMNNPSDARDDVTLSLHHMAHFGIPEELPGPDTLDIIASATVSAADIPVEWTYVPFEFDNPVALPYDWSFVLDRSEPSDEAPYGFWLNNFANFDTGYAWVYFNGWNTGGAADMAMTIYQPYYTGFGGRKRVSSRRGKRRFASQESKTESDSSAYALAGTSSENPDDVSSSENKTSTSTAVIGTQS